MKEDIAFIRNRQRIVTRAFEGACEKLGIGLGSLDVWRRERVSQIAEECAAAGDMPLETLQARIVSGFGPNVKGRLIFSVCGGEGCLGSLPLAVALVRVAVRVLRDRVATVAPALRASPGRCWPRIVGYP